MNYSTTEDLGFGIWDFNPPPFYRGDEEKSTPSRLMVTHILEVA
jgi:hypothetical protein